MHGLQFISGEGLLLEQGLNARRAGNRSDCHLVPTAKPIEQLGRGRRSQAGEANPRSLVLEHIQILTHN